MRITFDPGARADLDHIFAWISRDNAAAAYAMISRIETRIALLATPGLEYMGRPGLDEGSASSSSTRTSLCTNCSRPGRKSSCGPYSTVHKEENVRDRDRMAETHPFAFLSVVGQQKSIEPATRSRY